MEINTKEKINSKEIRLRKMYDEFWIEYSCSFWFGLYITPKS